MCNSTFILCTFYNWKTGRENIFFFVKKKKSTCCLRKKYSKFLISWTTNEWLVSDSIFSHFCSTHCRWNWWTLIIICAIQLLYSVRFVIEAPIIQVLCSILCICMCILCMNIYCIHMKWFNKWYYISRMSVHTFFFLKKLDYFSKTYYLLTFNSFSLFDVDYNPRCFESDITSQTRRQAKKVFTRVETVCTSIAVLFDKSIHLCKKSFWQSFTRPVHFT